MSQLLFNKEIEDSIKTGKKCYKFADTIRKRKLLVTLDTIIIKLQA